MTAKQLIESHGQSLVGRSVATEPIGEYPGGVATVTELAPDPNAPEIVFNVCHPAFGPIGIFDWEGVTLVSDVAAVPHGQNP